MRWSERIEINPAVLTGKPVIRSTRLSGCSRPMPGCVPQSCQVLRRASLQTNTRTARRRAWVGRAC